MDAVVDHSIALIVAPAGAGKSVLLAQWAATHPELRFVWLEIVSSDDDPVRFRRRLLNGLAEIDPGFVDVSPLTSMHGEGLGDAFLDDLAVQMTELPEVIIVLEDLHHLSNAALVSDLARLSELLPRNVHLVLSSRADLPIAWSRQRMRLDITEIRQVDLAFDDTDSAELLQRITGQSFSADSVTALVNRTEGWAAGLQLAGMNLRLHEDPDNFVTQFSGTDRLIADYLSEEVLRAQPHDRRQLLLQMSVPDEMSADLIGYLTGTPNAQGILEELERDSMFLVPLDSSREWYRFHHLFRDLLRFRLRAEHPELESRLLHKAAEWHLQRGNADVAVECLMSARDWDAALRPDPCPGLGGVRAWGDGYGDPLAQHCSRVRAGRSPRGEPASGTPAGNGGAGCRRRRHPATRQGPPHSHPRRGRVRPGLSLPPWLNSGRITRCPSTWLKRRSSCSTI